MPYFFKLSYRMLYFITLVSFSIKAQECNDHKLHDFIYKIADSLYCEAECYGGGNNGENFKNIITQNIEIFKKLLESEKNFINSRDKKGRTPLIIASYYHISEFIELLIQKNANTTIRCLHKLTPLDYVQLRTNNEPESINFLILLIMNDYYTKERSNKCVNLLTTTRKPFI